MGDHERTLARPQWLINHEELVLAIKRKRLNKERGRGCIKGTGQTDADRQKKNNEAGVPEIRSPEDISSPLSQFRHHCLSGFFFVSFVI